MRRRGGLIERTSQWFVSWWLEWCCGLVIWNWCVSSSGVVERGNCGLVMDACMRAPQRSIEMDADADDAISSPSAVSVTRV
jgi:hypothetical protein